MLQVAGAARRFGRPPLGSSRPSGRSLNRSAVTAVWAILWRTLRSFRSGEMVFSRLLFQERLLPGRLLRIGWIHELPPRAKQHHLKMCYQQAAKKQARTPHPTRLHWRRSRRCCSKRPSSSTKQHTPHMYTVIDWPPTWCIEVTGRVALSLVERDAQSTNRGRTIENAYNPTLRDSLQW